MLNKKFRLCEQAIFAAYFKVKDLPNAKKLARRAKISRQAFYTHHQSPQWIPYDYEKYLLDSYKAKMKILLERPREDIKKIYLRMLIFIYSHREVIGALLKDGRTEVIDRMIKVLKGCILREWNLAGDIEDVFHVYEKEVLGIIEIWAQNNFTKKKLDKVLNEILLLTKTSPRRLVQLIN